MTKILSEKAINDHYDKVKAYLTPLSMRSAEDIASDTEKEKEKALEMFRKNGVLKVNEKGLDWEIIG